MTSFAATLTQNLRSTYNGSMDAFEQRDTKAAGALDAFEMQSASPTGIFSADTKQKIKDSFGNTVQVPVINYRDVSISNVRTCDIYTGGPTSALVTLTFVTYSFGFPMAKAQFKNNDIAYQEAFNRNLLAYLYKLKKEMDQDAVDVLEANKNTYWPASITSYYAQSGDALRVPLAQRDDFYNQAGSIVTTMDFSELSDVVVNPQAGALIRRLAAQGTNNATNTAFQFDGYRWHTSNRVVNNSGVSSTHYLIANDVLGIESRIDPDSQMGSSVPGGSKTWDSVTVPIINREMGLYYQADCSDISALQSAGLTNLTNSLVESFQYSVDVCYAVTYNSSPSTQFMPIVKAEILTT